MRDFRDAKAMARTLRASLAAKGLKITISQSLEMIAEAFGVADWNTFAAAIRTEGSAPRIKASPSPAPTVESVSGPGPGFGGACEMTLHAAFNYATQREHDSTTLEHLLLALVDDVDASAVMKASNVDLDALKNKLTSFVDNELRSLVNPEGDDAKPTAAFLRVTQHAALYVQGLKRHTVTGAHLLMAIFAERESDAARFLGEQNMTRQDAVNFIVPPITPQEDEMGKSGVEQGWLRQSWRIRPVRPVVVEKVKRRTAAPRDEKT
jgi:hypothetical protein